MAYWQRLARFFGSLFGSIGLTISALAHHLPDKFFIDNGKILFSSASQILVWHALALVFLSFCHHIYLKYVSFLMALGTFFFSSALITLALRGYHLPYVAPTGGILLIMAWLLMGMSAIVTDR